MQNKLPQRFAKVYKKLNQNIKCLFQTRYLRQFNLVKFLILSLAIGMIVTAIEIDNRLDVGYNHLQNTRNSAYNYLQNILDR